MIQPLQTTLRKRVFLAGSFETDAANAPPNQLGDGVVTHSATGVWLITLNRNYGVMESGTLSVDSLTGDQVVRGLKYSNSSGVTVLTAEVIDVSGAALADIDGPRINWQAVFSGRAT